MATTITLRSKNPGPAIILQSLGGIVVPANGGTYAVVPDIISEVDFLNLFGQEMAALVAAGNIVLIVGGTPITDTTAAAMQGDPASQEDIATHVQSTANGGTNWDSHASSGVVKVQGGTWQASGIITSDFDVGAGTFDTDGSLAANSDVRIASQKAVKTYSDTAIHKAVSGEINAIASKAAPVAADILLIEDSAGSFAKAKATVGVLRAGMFGCSFAGTTSAAPYWTATEPASWTAIGRFYFPGTTVDSVSKMVCSAWHATGATCDVRIQDITNGQTIASITGITQTAAGTIQTTASIANLPAAGAIFEVQVQKTSGTAVAMYLSFAYLL